MNPSKWDARCERASALEKVYPFASEGLRFYQRVAQAQKSIYGELKSRLGKLRKQRPVGGLRQEFDSTFLLPRFPGFLSVIEQSAPAALAQSARALREKSVDHSKDVLTRFWEAGSVSSAQLEPAEALLAWAFLQPYAECLADSTEQPAIHETPSCCPLCSGKAQVGVLRQEGDGAKRSLICVLCAHEWEFRRLICSDCGEEDVHKLAIYFAEGITHVRVEACDACRHYIKTVDLTKDGHAVPVVDELATIPLNLWATEHGYTKSETNLLGL